MSQRRIFVDGAIYFVTSRTFDHYPLFKSDYYCRLFLTVLDSCRKKLKFELFAFAVMPDHVHLLIRPNSRNSVSDTVRHIKGRFARLVNLAAATEDEFLGCGNGGDNQCYTPFGGEEFILADEKHKPNAGEEFILAEGRIWQRSFYDRIIRCDRHLSNTINYIDNNAVRHRLVDDPINWLYSSYHNRYQTGKEIIRIDYL